MGGKITFDKSIDQLKWASMSGKEQENHISAMIDQYCIQQIYQG